MIEEANNNRATVASAVLSGAGPGSVAADALRTAQSTAVRHLYVHVPFCARICPYCAFYKELLDRAELTRFCEALLRELKQYAEQRRFVPATIYFGGGTPSALSTLHLGTLLEGFHALLDLCAVTEWTIEANPGSVSPRKAALLRQFGVHRISLGVQSWDDDMLALLGREHTAAQAEQSFRVLREAGFANINIDLMFGLPGQTQQQWRKTLDETVALEPEHISAYCLTYEEDTEFFRRHARGEFRQDPDVDAEFFDLAISILQTAGYEQYEVSNYARPGFESAHNRAYWMGQDYLGIGPSAVSTFGLRRWQNVPNHREYADRLLHGSSPVETIEDLTPAMKRRERIALGLRTRDGVRLDDGSDYTEQTRELVTLGLLQETNGIFILTPRGKSLADSVAEAFM
jgi:oxygen-independent coproporphyrinogen III oxidase